MKFIYFMLCAVFVGIVLSFAYISATTPQPVLTPKTVITPVPTPDPEYEDSAMLMNLVKISIIASIGMIVLGIVIKVFSPPEMWY